jgi:hypothetical protein
VHLHVKFTNAISCYVAIAQSISLKAQYNSMYPTLMQENNCLKLPPMSNRTTHIRHQCRKTTVLSYHRCLIELHVLYTNAGKNCLKLPQMSNRTTCIRPQCRKTTVLSYSRCLIEPNVLDTNAGKQLS